MTGAAWRTTNLGALLFAASGRVIAVKLAAVHAAGFTDLTAAQLALFHALDCGGTRVATLAVRARLSKASIAELIDRAEAGGLVARRADPADARGRIVALTAAGERLAAALGEGLAAADRELAAVLGSGVAARLKERLGHYIAADPALLPPEGDAVWAGANAGRAFALAAARFVAEVSARVTAAGFVATPAVLGMIRHLDVDGGRLTDLAAAARMTKPAMRELVDRAAARGFVVRQPNPRDGRATAIVFTPRGLALLGAVELAVVTAESTLAMSAGVAALDEMRGQLVRLTLDERAAA